MTYRIWYYNRKELAIKVEKGKNKESKRRGKRGRRGKREAGRVVAAVEPELL